MDINEYSSKNVHVMEVSGRLDSNTSKEFEDVISERMQEKQALVVDLAHVDYVSSAGLRVLLKAAKIAKSNGHNLALGGLKPQVQEVFDISGFTSIFSIHPSSKAACDSLQ
ncbi:STAS domain-containing protein [Fodinicurvata sediminis]|uniref:STAS domain-containing protein n=1 Tax=Fodinicurvata sediminis TaxID=1121832 RepID=UPI0003B65761|nr:STAS domain-containing protein [Fodinicurvata sediminis]